ncbi:hypothetical protein [Streptomyces sp. NPDC048445]|uniref:hypothetical protein n=1 Tax=Streptomyces sp. NPDC048445 TaxID=3365553 RepID=UPI003721157D
MTAALHPDAALAKHRTLKHWNEAEHGRPARTEYLTGWDVSRTGNGSLLLSARVVGPDPGAALREFGAWQQMRLARWVDPAMGDQSPLLDFSVPGRTAFTWRMDGVWVEVWHPNTPAPVPGPVRAAQTPSRPVPAPPVQRPTVSTPSGRLPLSRLARIRRTLTTKEN